MAANVTIKNGKYYKDGKLFSGVYTVPGTGQKITMRSGVPVPLAMPSPGASASSSASPAQGGAIANLTGGATGAGAGQYANRLFLGVDKGIKTAAEAKTDFYKWTDKERNAFIKKLGSFGFKGITPAKAEQLYMMAVDGASTWYSKSAGVQQITPEQYLKWNSPVSTSTAGPKTYGEKQVYLYDEASIQSLIDGTLSNVLGRSATAAESKEFYTTIQTMINKGTVTIRKNVTDPATGKLVVQSTTTPGFSEEAAKKAIEDKLKLLNPDDYDRKKRIDFSSWLSQNIGGA